MIELSPLARPYAKAVFSAALDAGKQVEVAKQLKLLSAVSQTNEISGLIDDQQEKLDSIIRVNEFINQWAINKILRSGAKLNLSENKLSEINSMVYDYETELLSNSYLEALVNSTIKLETDSIELDSLYKRNYEVFKLNEDLIQYVFIYISNTNPDVSQIRGKLRRYKEQDKVLLDSISYQFISSSFDDSTWHRRNELFKTIPILNNYRYNSLKKYKFFQFKDSLGLYLIKITSLLTKGQYAPIEYVSPTLEYMIVNKRKVVTFTFPLRERGVS